MKPIFCKHCKEPIVDPDDVVITDIGAFHSECFEKKRSEKYRVDRWRRALFGRANELLDREARRKP